MAEEVTTAAQKVLFTDDQIANYSKFLDGLFDFKKLIAKAIKKHDWTTFAKYYNGPLYKENNYDTKLATNYSQYKDL